MQAGGGAGEVGFFGDDEEVLQVAELHKQRCSA
jgi:hypothetical protein